MASSRAATLCSLCMDCLISTDQDEESDGINTIYHEGDHHMDFASWEASIHANCLICAPFWAQMHPSDQEYIKSYPNEIALTKMTVSRSSQEQSSVDVEILLVEVIFELSEGTRQFVLEPLKRTGLSMVASDKNVNLQYADISNVALYESSGASTADSLDLARLWTKTCAQSHPKCAHINDGWMPTRLLDVSGELVRLVLRDEVPPEASYMTMSHCWGDAQFYKLTHKTLSQLRQGINESILSDCFQQGIVVTRLFQVSYLWIDALCILQGEDASADWEREAVTMHRVYTGSFLNVSATAARDRHTALFCSRDRHGPEFHRVTLPADSLWNEGIETEYALIDGKIIQDNFVDAPLHKRGWVVQERFLAPRTLHFCSGQLFWDCRTRLLCELYPIRVPSILHSAYTMLKTSIMYRTVNTSLESDTNKSAAINIARVKWIQIMIIYSACRLTYDTDKVIALSGIAKFFQASLQDDYVFGLWRKHLIKSLAWTIKDNSTSQGHFPVCRVTAHHNRAPSWSWLSYNGLVTPASYEEDEFELTKVLEGRSKYQGHDLTNAASSGLLHLSGPLSKLEILPPDYTQVKIQIGGEFWLEEFHPDIASIDLEHLSKHDRIFAIHLCTEYRQKNFRPPFFIKHYILVLECVEGSTEIYERVGIIVLEREVEEPLQHPSSQTYRWKDSAPTAVVFLR